MEEKQTKYAFIRASADKNCLQFCSSENFEDKNIIIRLHKLDDVSSMKSKSLQRLSRQNPKTEKYSKNFKMFHRNSTKNNLNQIQQIKRNPPQKSPESKYTYPS